MSKVNLIDSTGQASGDYEVNAAYLEFEKGEQVVQEAVIAYLAGLRGGNACTKTRGEKRGGGRKPWKQKGTGNARAGSNRSPIWTGGGVTFGPKPRSYAKALNKKAKRLSVRRALAERVQAGDVVVVEEYNFAKPKTKEAVAFLTAANATNRPVIILDDTSSSETAYLNAGLSFGNVNGAYIVDASSCNAYDLLSGNTIIVSKSALEVIGKRIAVEA